MFITITILLISVILLFTPPLSGPPLGVLPIAMWGFRLCWTLALLIVAVDILGTSAGQPGIPDDAYALIDLVFVIVTIFRYKYAK